MTTLAEAIQGALEDLEGQLADQGKGPVRNGLRMALDTLRSHLLKHLLSTPVKEVPGQQVIQEVAADTYAVPAYDPAAAPPPPRPPQQQPREDLPPHWKQALERGRQAVLALVEQMQVEGNVGEAERLAQVAAAWQVQGRLKVEPPAPVFDKNIHDVDNENGDSVRTDSPIGT